MKVVLLKTREYKIYMDNQLELNKKEEHYDGYRFRCGCTIKIPHSHLVVGQSCECEKGETKLEIYERI